MKKLERNLRVDQIVFDLKGRGKGKIQNDLNLNFARGKVYPCVIEDDSIPEEDQLEDMVNGVIGTIFEATGHQILEIYADIA